MILLTFPLNICMYMCMYLHMYVQLQHLLRAARKAQEDNDTREFSYATANNWFSCNNALRIYSYFLELDNDQNGWLFISLYVTVCMYVPYVRMYVVCALFMWLASKYVCIRVEFLYCVHNLISFMHVCMCKHVTITIGMLSIEEMKNFSGLPPADPIQSGSSHTYILYIH